MTPLLHTLRTLVFGLITLLFLAAGIAPAMAQGRPERPPFPLLNLPDNKAFGARAIELLGNRLPEVAAYYGKTADQLRAQLTLDRKLKIDRRGRLFFEEELDQPLPANAPMSSLQSDSVSGALVPLDQTFTLHSRPGAQRTIYLNFKGATLSGTAWNGSGGTITALPFDLDGIPYSFNSAELERIQYIWQRVSEDYAPFDIDVTTEEPPLDRLVRSSSSDTVYGTTALITNNTGVYNCSCGGVAYLSVFDDTREFYKPALVFYNKLGNGNEKYVAEAISHEVGHNGGLAHDGTSSTGYYQGQGSGATGWAPIMGVGYYQALVQWSKGEYSGANNTEDDFVVTQSNGMPLRADDHGNSAGTATLMNGVASGGLTALYVEGVIERSGDVDVFAVTAAAGNANFALNPASRSANLDAQIELRDAAGTLLASANPADALGASMTAVLQSAGTYYVSVRGVGKGDPQTTGYTAYGSLGQYVLTGSVASPGNQAPIAQANASPSSGTVPLTVNFSSAGSSDPDGNIVAYDWNFGNGSTASGQTPSTTYTNTGNFTATLRVTDNSGLTASRSVTITVNPQVTILPMSVGNIAMSLTPQPRGKTSATAVVPVLSSNGNPVPGATVTGSWSGIVSGSVSAVTNSSGTVSFTSSSTKKRGTFTFTVTGISLTGYEYRPDLNEETSDFISY